MGWFSPVKGSYPSLAQVDKTLPLDSGVTALERGQIIALDKDTDGNPVWVLPKATSKMLYVALQDKSDPTAGFAGTAFDPKGGVPAITGIDLAQDGEYETSVFAGAADDSVTYEIGDELKVNADGYLAKTGVTGVVGYVTSVPTTRWINNAVATPPGQTDQRLATRTGASRKVIRFKTAV